MKNNKTPFLNTYIDNLTMEETLQHVESAIAENRQIHHVVVNAGKIVAMQSDSELLRSVNESDIINADGQAIVWASKFLGKPLKERVAGIDLMENLVSLAALQKLKVYFLGAKEEVLQSVIRNYTNLYGEDIIAGARNGYFKEHEQSDVASEIAASGADILFVAISSPTKENFLYNNKGTLKGVSFIMGVGGSFDVVAGKVKRAPIWMQKSGLEWFYRFIQEPNRMWKRYLIGNSKFIYLILKEKFTNSK